MLKRFLSRFWVLAFVLIVAACGGGDGSNGNANNNPSAQGTTLMVYMVGSDLESNPDLRAGTSNLNEMLKAAAAANVNVVIETGGANVADVTTIVKTWRSVKRHVLKNGQLQELADIGAQNMGASQTLTDFITWAAKSYPAANYRLVLWDHGAGWKGFGLDENQTAQKSMTVPQMTAGIDGGARAAGIRFDVIGFDACLMATAEVAAALAPDADYLLASEELEPGSGWDWKVAIENAGQSPTVFGRAVVDSFIAKQLAGGDGGFATLSLVDLSKIGSVTKALGNFAADLQANITSTASWVNVAKQRALATSFGGTAKKADDHMDEVDIAHFADLLSGAGIVAQSSQNLSAAVRSAVVYAKNGPYYPKAAGLSLYFPGRTVSKTVVGGQYAPLNFLPGYTDFLNRYVGLADGAAYVIQLDMTPSTATTIAAQISSTFGIETADAVLSTPVAADGTVTISGTMPVASLSDYGLAQHPLGGNWITLNGQPVLLSWMTHVTDPGTGANSDLYAVPMQWKNNTTFLIVSHTAGSSTWTAVGTWAGEDGAMESRLGPLPAPTDSIAPLTMVYNPTTNDVVNLVPGTSFAAGSLTFASTPLPAAYLRGILVTDFAGNTQLSPLRGLPM